MFQADAGKTGEILMTRGVKQGSPLRGYWQGEQWLLI